MSEITTMHHLLPLRTVEQLCHGNALVAMKVTSCINIAVLVTDGGKTADSTGGAMPGDASSPIADSEKH